MKKLILLFTLFFSFSILILAKPVDENKAKMLGEIFLKNQSAYPHLVQTASIHLVYKAIAGKEDALAATEVPVYYYIFNADSKGFIIISGDDRVQPVLAYSGENKFDENNIPDAARKWMESYKAQILFAVQNQIEATEAIEAAWQGQFSTSNSSAKRGSVAALVQTKWNQSPYYNALCPSNSVTGCVATAMAQVMKYHNYPSSGSGFHSYNHSSYGTLSANFGSTTYQWSSMPNSVNSSNTAVATLMYHCGVSVDMDYSPNVSGAYVISSGSPVTHCSEYAMKTYFGYKSSMQGIKRAAYSESDWINKLKTELDASRPILYAGFGSGGGHAFVCDGYDLNNYFHFNWGWGGAYDGYFSINALNPSGTGTGGGTGGYNTGHQALIGIEPPSGGGNTSYDMALYKNLSLSASTIYYGQSFSVSTNIHNQGSTNFSGDYCAAVFDMQSNFIDYVEIKTGMSLNGGYVYNNDLVFQNNSLLSMLPGSYFIKIFYKPTGGNWVQVSNGSYSNYTSITVVNPNDIELNKAMSVSPGTTLVQGQAASVNLNVVNDGNSTYYGQYQLNLYKLDGSFVQTIQTINETNGLPSGYTYTSPYLTFSTGSITADAGTYLLALIHKPNSSSSFQLAGSSNYSNPIKITVQSPSLPPDPYETNNTFAQAFSFPLVFNNNVAVKTSTGSNIHNDTDNDIYKINLSAGYTYSINARIHDSYNSGNGNTYTVDGLLSYSTDGSTWSEAFDDIIANPIQWAGSGTLYFRVSPYFESNTGSYLLDFTVTRTSSTSIQEQTWSEQVKLYPNPASTFLNIDLTALQTELLKMQLINIQGQTVLSLAGNPTNQNYMIQVSELPAGLYVLLLETKEGRLTKNIAICR